MPQKVLLNERIHIKIYKNRLKISKIARNRDFFKETIFSQKIAEKIGRFFGDFLGKNRQKLAGRLQKIVCLKKFRKPKGGGGGE
jgi:hypothetical protein